jgi:dCTP deaminase
VILPDLILREYLADGRVVVTPLGEHAVRPASIDLRLGALLTVADVNEADGWRCHDLREAPYRLMAGAFVLGHTLEWIEIPPMLAGVLAGKSSRAREGIQVEAAGYVDPGWRGELTVEIAMLRPGAALLTLGMPICQLRLEMLLAPAEAPYGSDGTSHYQASRGPVPSRTLREVRP